jgi:hypothetical protein
MVGADTIAFARKLQTSNIGENIADLPLIKLGQRAGDTTAISFLRESSKVSRAEVGLGAISRRRRFFLCSDSCS